MNTLIVALILGSAAYLVIGMAASYVWAYSRRICLEAFICWLVAVSPILGELLFRYLFGKDICISKLTVLIAVCIDLILLHLLLDKLASDGKITASHWNHYNQIRIQGNDYGFGFAWLLMLASAVALGVYIFNVADSTWLRALFLAYIALFFVAQYFIGNFWRALFTEDSSGDCHCRSGH